MNMTTEKREQLIRATRNQVRAVIAEGSITRLSTLLSVAYHRAVKEVGVRRLTVGLYREVVKDILYTQMLCDHVTFTRKFKNTEKEITRQQEGL